MTTHTITPARHRRTWPALVAAALSVTGLVVAAQRVVAANHPAAKPPTPAVSANPADEILGFLLSERFPNVRQWMESYDSAAFPNSCLRISPLPCP